MNRLSRLIACCALVAGAGATFAAAAAAAARESARPQGLGAKAASPEPAENSLIGRANRTDPAVETPAPEATNSSTKKKKKKKKKHEHVVHVVAAPGTLRAKPAKPGDVVAGAAITDRVGQQLGRIEVVHGDEAVVVTSAGRVRMPVNAFGKSYKGLLVDMHRKEFEQLVAQGNLGR